MKPSPIRLALPSKGVLEKDTMNFLAAAGMRVHRPNARQYVASVPSTPDLTVLFQRAPDIFKKVAEGDAAFGITGYDIVREYGFEHDEVVVLRNNLGYGGCRLALAVPEAWIDVSSIEDLADLAVMFKAEGRDLRLATKFPNLTKQWLYSRGIIQFALVAGQGALEVAPSMGYADLIVDIVSSGMTLRENRLKELTGGTILYSEACLIGNRMALKDARVEKTAVYIIERIEARDRAPKFISITANMQGESPEAIAALIHAGGDLAGARGPSIAKVYGRKEDGADWYTLSIIVKRQVMLEAVAHLRDCGGSDIAITSPDYLFDAKPLALEFEE